jgi:hypothetical protein
LTASHRKSHEQNHEHNRERDHDYDDTGANREHYEGRASHASPSRGPVLKDSAAIVDRKTSPMSLPVVIARRLRHESRLPPS